MANSSSGNMKITIDAAPEHLDALAPILGGSSSLKDLAPGILEKARNAGNANILPQMASLDENPPRLQRPMQDVPVTPSGPVMAKSNILGMVPPATADATAPPQKSLLRKVGGVLGKIAEVAGQTFFPGAVEAIPGTDLHNQMLERRKQHAALAGAEVEKTQAEATDLRAKAAASEREYTAPKTGWGGYLSLKPGTSDVWEPHQWDANSRPLNLEQEEASYIDKEVAKGRPWAEVAGEVYGARNKAARLPEGETPLGAERVDQLNKTMKDRFQLVNPNQDLPSEFTLSDKSTQKDYDRLHQSLQQLEQGAAAMSKEKPVAGESDGQRVYGVYEPGKGWLDSQTRASLPKFIPPPSFAQTGFWKPEAVVTPGGKTETMRMNARTGQLEPIVVPGGGDVLAPGAIGGQQYQATVINEAGDRLIETIKANKSKLGNVGAIINSAFLGTPLADPVSAGISAQLSSFAALNPKLHGFRGSRAMDEFKKLVGGLPTNPEALIAAIQGIQSTAGIVAPASGQSKLPAGGGQDDAPPANLLKEGKMTTFANGQTWTLKNGVPTKGK